MVLEEYYETMGDTCVHHTIATYLYAWAERNRSGWFFRRMVFQPGAVYLSQDLVIESNIPDLNLPGDTFIEDAPETGKSELTEA